MMTKSKQSLNNIIPKKPFSPSNPYEFGVKELRPNYSWLDLIDTERYGQKTYHYKNNFIPTVYRGVGGVDVGLELVNYFHFQSYSGIFAFQPTIQNIRQSYELPSPSFEPDIVNYPQLMPMIYDGYGEITILKSGVYNLSLDFDLEILDNVKSVSFISTSSILGDILNLSILASSKIIKIPGIITSGTDSLGGPISGVTESTYIFDDLSDILQNYSGKKDLNIYLEKDTILTFKILVGNSSGGLASGNIRNSNIFLSYLRTSR